MRCTARATRSQPRRSWASVAPTSTASSMNSTSEGQYHSRRTTCGSMRSVPPRGSGWVMIVTRACRQRLTHPLPRGGTDLMTRARQPSPPLPRGGTDLMTRARQPSHHLRGTDSSLYNQCVMASLQQRLPENVPGDFFVDSTCIDCDTCSQLDRKSVVQG